MMMVPCAFCGTPVEETEVIPTEEGILCKFCHGQTENKHQEKKEPILYTEGETGFFILNHGQFNGDTYSEFINKLHKEGKNIEVHKRSTNYLIIKSDLAWKTVRDMIPHDIVGIYLGYETGVLS